MVDDTSSYLALPAILVRGAAAPAGSADAPLAAPVAHQGAEEPGQERGELASRDVKCLTM